MGRDGRPVALRADRVVDVEAGKAVEGRVVLVAAHGNSLRALVKHLDGISDADIVSLNVPTGIPLVYELDERLRPTSSGYLGDPEAAARAARAVADQASATPDDAEPDDPADPQPPT